MRFIQPSVAGITLTKSPNGLREGSFNPRTFGIMPRILHFVNCLELLKLCLGTKRDLSGLHLGLGATVSLSTRAAVFLEKLTRIMALPATEPD